MVMWEIRSYVELTSFGIPIIAVVLACACKCLGLGASELLGSQRLWLGESFTETSSTGPEKTLHGRSCPRSVRTSTSMYEQQNTRRSSNFCLYWYILST
ncbi:hypothetical protein J3E68DRAFT_399395 [Trichoderma sp. SZMC 28012]